MAYTDKITWNRGMFGPFGTSIKPGGAISSVSHVALNPSFGHAYGSEIDGVGWNYIMNIGGIKVLSLLYVPTALPASYIDPNRNYVIGTISSQYKPSYNSSFNWYLYMSGSSNVIIMGLEKQQDGSINLTVRFNYREYSNNWVGLIWNISYNYGS